MGEIFTKEESCVGYYKLISCINTFDRDQTFDLWKIHLHVRVASSVVFICLALLLNILAALTRSEEYTLKMAFDDTCIIKNKLS